MAHHVNPFNLGDEKHNLQHKPYETKLWGYCNFAFVLKVSYKCYIVKLFTPLWHILYYISPNMIKDMCIQKMSK